MKNYLIAYATNSGSTEEVAQAIATELSSAEVHTDVLRLEDVTAIEAYDAVVIGAPMILGWHRRARQFVHRHRQALSGRPVAYFCTAMSLTATGETYLERIPVCVDPELAKPPQNSQRLSFRERYATLPNYLRPMLKAGQPIRPVSFGVFGGKLEMFRLKWWQMLFVMIIIRATPGDRRNWDVIREWAAGLKPLLAQ